MNRELLLTIALAVTVCALCAVVYIHEKPPEPPVAGEVWTDFTGTPVLIQRVIGDRVYYLNWNDRQLDWNPEEFSESVNEFVRSSESRGPIRWPDIPAKE